MPVRSVFCSPFSRMSVRRSSYGVLIFVMSVSVTDFVLWGGFVVLFGWFCRGKRTLFLFILNGGVLLVAGGYLARLYFGKGGLSSFRNELHVLILIEVLVNQI